MFRNNANEVCNLGVNTNNLAVYNPNITETNIEEHFRNRYERYSKHLFYKNSTSMTGLKYLSWLRSSI